MKGGLHASALCFGHNTWKVAKSYVELTYMRGTHKARGNERKTACAFSLFPMGYMPTMATKATCHAWK